MTITFAPRAKLPPEVTVALPPKVTVRRVPVNAKTCGPGIRLTAPPLDRVKVTPFVGVPVPVPANVISPPSVTVPAPVPLNEKFEFVPFGLTTFRLLRSKLPDPLSVIVTAVVLLPSVTSPYERPLP